MSTKIQIFLRNSSYVCIVVILAVAIRVYLTVQGWPVTNSDEGTVGIMALHIAAGKDYPIIFYGQGYMGTMEAYIGAFFFHLLGPSIFTLRLGVILLFALFLVIMYMFTKLLYTRHLAHFILLLLAFGAPEMLAHQLLATAGHPETPLFSVLLLLLPCWLALSIKPAFLEWVHPRRDLLYGLWGFIAGFAFWNDFIVFPFIVTGCILLALTCRPEIKKSTIFLIFVGFLLGILPLLLFTASTPLLKGPFALLGTMLWHGQSPHMPSLWQAIVNTITVSIPGATGGDFLCALPQDGTVAALSRCTLLHAGWGSGFLLLLAIAFWQSWHRYRKLISEQSDKPYEKRRATILCLARLLLLSSVILTILLYTFSVLPPALYALSDSRYLVSLPVAFPALLWPLWTQAVRGKQPHPILRSIHICLLSFVLGALLIGASGIVSLVPAAHTATRQTDTLIQKLEQMHLTHIYSEYWTCNKLAFLTDEQITCAVLGNTLRTGYNRYLPYLAAVRTYPLAAYVFPLHSPQEALLTKQKRYYYQPLIVAGYVIYQPRLTEKP